MDIVSAKRANHSLENKALYVVTCRRDGNDVRARAAVVLGNTFGRCDFVYPTRQISTDNPWAIRPWRNPLKIFEILGLVSLSQILGRWLFFPSPDILFIHTVKRRLLCSIHRDLHEGLQVSVLLTAPPHASVTLVKQIKQLAPSVRVIVDWQDLWSYDESYFLRVPKPYRKRLLSMEQGALEQADLNITTNERARELLVRRHQLAPQKVVAIGHHFSPSQVVCLKTGVTATGICRVGFLGNLFKPPKVRGDKIFTLFDRLAEHSAVSLELIGDTTGKAWLESEKMTHRCVRLHDRIPLDKAIAKLATMDLLLLTLEDLANSKIIMHGKLPAYLAAGVPIVALVPDDSFVADLVRETGAGFVLSDPDRWEKELSIVVNKVLAGTLKYDRKIAKIDLFGWHKLSDRWLEALVAD